MFRGNLSIGIKGELRWQMVKNEFECLHVNRFTEPDIVQFTDAVDATHGIYEHRCARRRQMSYPQALCAARAEV